MNRSYRWQILALAMIMQAFIVGVTVYCFGFFVVHWLAEFERPRGELMLGYSAMSFVAGVIAPMVGVLIDRYTKRVLVLLGIGSYVAGLLLLAWAPAAWLVVTIYGLVLPIAMALAGPLMAQTLVAGVFDERRGTALGLCSLGTSIGGFVMPIIVTGCLDIYAWRQVMVLLALCCAVLLIPLAFYLLRPSAATLLPSSVGGAGVSSKSLFSDSNSYKLAFAYFVPSFMFVGVLQNMGLFAADIQLSQQQAGVVVSVAAGLMAVGKFAVGWLADRCSYRLIYNVVVLAVALSLYLTATAANYGVLLVAVAALGAFAGGLTPLFGAIVAQRYGLANFGRVMGLIMGTASLSGLAPLGAAWLRDTTGSYETTFLWFVPLVIPAIIAFNRLSKPE